MTTRRDVLGAIAGVTASAALGVWPAGGISDREARHEDPAYLFRWD